MYTCIPCLHGLFTSILSNGYAHNYVFLEFSLTVYNTLLSEVDDFLLTNDMGWSLPIAYTLHKHKSDANCL